MAHSFFFDPDDVGIPQPSSSEVRLYGLLGDFDFTQGNLVHLVIEVFQRETGAIAKVDKIVSEQIFEVTAAELTNGLVAGSPQFELQFKVIATAHASVQWAKEFSLLAGA
jgi:hypothetical protein